MRKDINILSIILLVLIMTLILVFTIGCEVKEIIEEDKFTNTERVIECETDSDCVKASCCHASSCTIIENAPDCKGTFCTTDCQKGTLDCGQGSCACVSGKCDVVMRPE